MFWLLILWEKMKVHFIIFIIILKIQTQYFKLYDFSLKFIEVTIENISFSLNIFICTD